MIANTPCETSSGQRPVEVAAAIDAIELARLSPIHRLEGRNGSKADVSFYSVNGRGIAVKSYSRRPLWIRATLGRWLTRRETSAYQAAEGLPGLPLFLGRLDNYTLATEWIVGRSLPEFGATLVDDQVFDRIAATLRDLHERGIALADLHHRNVLVQADGRVLLVDLAAAMVLGEKPGLLRRGLFDRLTELDFLALARMRARWTGGDIAAAVARINGRVARWHAQGRRLKTVWNHLRRRHR